MTPPRVNIHASCVALARAGDSFGAPRDAGVLLLGESGSGKSDLALRLIAMGATLVADDRCDLFVASGALRAAAPKALAGMIELRGVGIVHLRHQPDVRVVLAVRFADATAIPRLPDTARYVPTAPFELPEQRLPHEILIAPFEASAPAKILAAAAEFARHPDR